MSKSRMPSRLPYDRADRVAEQVYQVVASAFLRDFTDPCFRGVAITRVRVTRDLRLARIYYYLPVNENRDLAQTGMENAIPQFKKLIAREMRLRYVPEIQVFHDDGIDHEDRIEELLRVSRGEHS